jgi:hypothetical protein
MSSKHSTWCWHCLLQATVNVACHVLYAMVVHELKQSCLWIGKGGASIDQGLIVYAGSGRAVADKKRGSAGRLVAAVFCYVSAIGTILLTLSASHPVDMSCNTQSNRLRQLPYSRAAHQQGIAVVLCAQVRKCPHKQPNRLKDEGFVLDDPLVLLKKTTGLPFLGCTSRQNQPDHANTALSTF